MTTKPHRSGAGILGSGMIEAIHIDDRRWDELVSNTDIFYQRPYLKAFARGNSEFLEAFSGEPVLLYYEDNDGFVVHPVFMRDIPDTDFKDIISPYGCSGPAAIGRPLFVDYLRSMTDFCKDNKIISEFNRLHPWLTTVFPSESIEKGGEVFYIDLQKSMNDIVAAMDRKCRNAIKNAEKDVTVREINDYYTLYNHYTETMTRNGAHKRYFFDLKFFMKLPNAKIFIASKDGKDIASSVFFHHNKFSHYYLSGSSQAAFGTNATSLIIWNAINYYKKLGCTMLNLGGTIGGSPGLYRFKSSFTDVKNCVKPFMVVKKVHNRPMYKELCQKAGKNPFDGGYFPAYRSL